MRRRVVVAALLGLAGALSCGEGAYFDEVEARACPDVTVEPLGDVPAAATVTLVEGTFDCALGALRIRIEAVEVPVGVTMAYVELLDVPRLLVVNDVIEGPFPSRGEPPFFASARPVESSPEDLLLVNGSMTPSSARGGTVFVVEFHLIRRPHRNETVELRIDPLTSALFGPDFGPLPGVTFVGARLRFR